MFKQRSVSRSGQLLVQNIQLVLGLLYHLSISQEGGDHLCKECRLLEHHLILTRDKNKDFHIFQHTTRHSEPTFSGPEWHEIATENCTCSLLTPGKTHASIGERQFAPDQGETLLWTDESHHLHPYNSHLHFYSPLHTLQKYEDGHCAIKPGQVGCEFQSVDKQHQLRPLRVATYNIWNVNSLSDVKESYEGRITRLGKVSQQILL